MNDTELLDLAAKACGFELLDCTCKKERKNSVTGKHWNPLTSNGDLYILARTVGIDISFGDKSAYKRLSDGNLIQTFWGEIPDHPDEEVDDEAHAIVRVAAEIGKYK